MVKRHAPPGLHVEFLERVPKAMRAPPESQLLGVCPAFKDQRTGRIEHAGGNNFSPDDLVVFI
jgi:hypothetical protein